MSKIKIISLNQEKEGTCGSCYYSDNNLGIVALHCTCKKKEAKKIHWDDYGKVRSWEKCKHWKKKQENKK